jgi:hypothetical protein
MIKDQFDSINKIAWLKPPVLVMHGELDQVIPMAHGKAILAAVTSPKEGVFFPKTGHNDFDSNAISAHVLAFAEKHNLIKR